MENLQTKLKLGTHTCLNWAVLIVQMKILYNYADRDAITVAGVRLHQQ